MAPSARVLLLLLLLLAAHLRTFLAFKLQWFSALTYVLVKWDRFKSSQFIVDFTAGAGSLSSPEQISVYAPRRQLLANLSSAEVASLSSELGALATTTTSNNNNGLLLVHQLGKKVVKKLPDSALLGVLVLIASELLQREVETQFLNLPPVLRAMANNTALELDTKLEYLSSLQWDVDPFLRAEIDNLQTQPLEVIDKFIVNEILPRVDTSLSPMLSNLIGDPNSVTLITRNIKDLIQVISVVITSTSSPSSSTTYRTRQPETLTETVMKQVDMVGESVETAIKDWNRIILDMGKIVKAESIIDLIPSSFLSSTSNSPFPTSSEISDFWMSRISSTKKMATTMEQHGSRSEQAHIVPSRESESALVGVARDGHSVVPGRILEVVDGTVLGSEAAMSRQGGQPEESKKTILSSGSKGVWRLGWRNRTPTNK